MAAGHFVRLVRLLERAAGVRCVCKSGVPAVSSRKNYWSKMNHKEAQNAIEMMTDDEAGRWLRGWLVGAAGEEMEAGKPIEWRTGFAAGRDSFRDAQEFSSKQAERVAARYAKATAVDPVDEILPDRTEATEATAEFRTLPITVQYSTIQDKQETKARRAVFSPDLFDEMLPAPLRGDAGFMDAWHSWASARHEKRKPITKRAAELQIKALESFGRAGAIASIRKSIQNDWTGLFPPEQAAGYGRPAPAQITIGSNDLSGIDSAAVDRL